MTTGTETETRSLWRRFWAWLRAGLRFLGRWLGMALDPVETLQRNPSAVPPDPAQTFDLMTLAQVLANGPDTGGQVIRGDGPAGEPGVVTAEATATDADSDASRSAISNGTGIATANTTASGGGRVVGFYATASEGAGSLKIRDGSSSGSGAYGVAGLSLLAQEDETAKWGQPTAGSVTFDPTDWSGSGDVQGALTELGHRIAAHVADGATVDDLRDALVAAGLMAPA